MIKTLLIKNYNATICKINMQTASNDVYSKLLKPGPLDQHLGPKRGSKLIRETYRENYV